MIRVLRVHNQYRVAGGEEAVFNAEVNLLRKHWHLVDTLEVSNKVIGEGSPGARLGLAVSTIWSREGRRLVFEAIERHRPDVVHFDNTLPRISPAAYSVAKEAGSAVVQTLHNYRLMCPNAMFLRNGGPCEDCLGKPIPLPGIIHGCYRNSKAQSAVVAAMITAHRVRGTWSRDVDKYIALTEFARNKFIEGGLPSDLLSVKPNFVSHSQLEQRERGDHFLFVGRLAREKGIHVILDSLKFHDERIRVIGDGPLGSAVAEAVTQHPELSSLGRLDPEFVRDEMLTARALIIPSVVYETFGLTAIEAFSCGLPVIASRLGAMIELVEEGETGLFFEAGNPNDLATKVCWAVENPTEMKRMGENARRVYEAKYTPERNYDMLMDIYEQAVHHARNRR